METFSVAVPECIVDKKIYGGKAYWLSWLIARGYNVPECFFIPAINENEFDEIKSFLKTNEKFNALLENFKNQINLYDVAIRSSAIDEDSFDASFAGHFKSFLELISYDDIFINIEKVVQSVKAIDKNDKQKIGVVIQKKINASFSGVLFSSNPITCSKNEMIISVIEGMGELLVSGKVSGEDILITLNSGIPDIPEYKTSIEKFFVKKLCTIAKSIEIELNVPVDIEWCVDGDRNELYLLQCRPITAIFPNYTGVIPINIVNKNLIPEKVKDNDKVKIRLLAQENNVDISNAYLVVNSNSSILDEIALSVIKPETRCKGYSVVLIFPKRISGNIVRQFAEKEMDRQDTAFRTCQRYDVRSYQDHRNLMSILQSIQAKCCEISWFCVAIIQEIFEPVFTGIAKKIEDGFLIEIAKGHFVPKGVVPTSQYILNSKDEIIFKNEIVQEYSFMISQGVVSKETINSYISLNQKTLSEVIHKLKPILLRSTQAVEFGLLENNKTKALDPYLIDLVDDNSQMELSSKLITEGVISTGIRTGKAKILDTKTFGHNSLELHFHDKFENRNAINEDIVFVTDKPDIALLEVLKYHNNDRIGFVFNEGSALSHFSIILREKRIPAIVIPKDLKINDMDEIKIDASTPGLKANERLTVSKACVTTYTNPDTDGICSAIAFSFLQIKKGKYFVPVYFGNLDKETIFVLDLFGVEFPKQVNSVEQFNEIVLVDTHHIAQLSNEITPLKVVEIIDHHPAGNSEKFTNAKIQNDEIGAACTIIAERIKSENIIPNQKIAGIMSLAIISNTLNFTAPSTSQRDKDAVEWLNEFTEISDEVISKMFSERSDVSEISTERIIKDNLKEFNWGNTKIGIAQIEMTNIEKIINRTDFLIELSEIKKSKNLNYIVFTGVNILKKNTLICCPDIETLKVINEGMGFNSRESTFLVDKILLRKTDFIPSLKKYFES